jgi:ABC-type transport system involved in multi-copper enzyme maturation permease subunit
MKKILYSAFYSFNEIKNSKIFYSFLIFALILISGSYFVSQTSFIDQGRIMVDFSIFAISIFNIFIGIFIGSSIIYDDIEKKSIFLNLTKPIKRSYYLGGRILGLILAIVMSTVIMTIIFYIVLLLMRKYVSPVYFGSISLEIMPQSIFVQSFFIIIESSFIAIIAILFSLITSKALASVFTIIILFIGEVSSRLNALVKPIKVIVDGKLKIEHHASPITIFIVHLLYTVLPNFSIFNISTETSYKINIPAGIIFYRFIYGLSYSILLFIIALVIFNKKDIA